MNEVGLPCFVKPDNSGSSLGISKVKTKAELGPALDKAFAEGPSVMCEALVKGRELTSGVARLNGELRALPVSSQQIIANSSTMRRSTTQLIRTIPRRNTERRDLAYPREVCCDLSRLGLQRHGSN